jgi:F-type H+-transporting ATPase subunit delta
MPHSAIASRYAGALVDVATDPKSRVEPHKLLGELRSFEEVLSGSDELRNALSTPAVPLGRKRAVLRRLGEILGLSTTARNLLFVLSDHRRIAMLGEVLEAFDVQVDERLGFTRAEISSAQTLSERQQEAVARELERLTGKKVRTRFAVDGALLGGVVARIGSTVYDGSVRGQLAALGKRLAAE